ncbi:MAG: hypothetical protein ACLQVI_35900 [Polyangiaceae bacterium]
MSGTRLAAPGSNLRGAIENWHGAKLHSAPDLHTNQNGQFEVSVEVETGNGEVHTFDMTWGPAFEPGFDLEFPGMTTEEQTEFNEEMRETYARLDTEIKAACGPALLRKLEEARWAEVTDALFDIAKCSAMSNEEIVEKLRDMVEAAIARVVHES